MPNPKCCPYCASPLIAPTIGAFLEIGNYADGAYALEGDAEGYACQNPDCGEKFWVNGPGDEMCYAVVNNETHETVGKHPATEDGHRAARLHLLNEAIGWCDKHNVPEDVRAKKLDFATRFDEVHLDGIGTLTIRILCMED